MATEVITEGRRERIPFGGSRKRLSTVEIPGYVTRWFNDQDDRIARAMRAGYEKVKDSEVGRVGDKEIGRGNTDVNSYVSTVVGRDRNNQGIRAYLMKIKKEYYVADQALKEQRNALVDEAILAGRAGGARIENQYGEVRTSVQRS